MRPTPIPTRTAQHPRIVRLSILLPILFSILPSSATLSRVASANKFGIGCYDDTPGSPSIAAQLDAAAALAGPGGWTILYLCSWHHQHGASCLNTSTASSDPASRAKLRAAYARNLTVVARIGNPYVVRDAADDAGEGRTGTSAPFTSFRKLAAAYARFIASLPLPPSDAPPLYVTVGNEFNACNEWRCSVEGEGGGVTSTSTSNMTATQMALEVAAFYRDVSDALAPVRAASGGRLLYGHGAIANWDTAPCECGTGRSLGGGALGLNFLKAMVESVPDLYASPARVDWLSSHSYPFSAAKWGEDKARRGLEYYRNETMVVRPSGSGSGSGSERRGGGAADSAVSAAFRPVPPPSSSSPSPLPSPSPSPLLDVIITETGWRRDPTRSIGGAERSNWTSLAFEHIWLPDPQILGVAPFLLGGAFWEGMGWSWMNVTGGDGGGSSDGGGSGGGDGSDDRNGGSGRVEDGRGGSSGRLGELTPNPVYTGVQRTRCEHFPSPSCLDEGEG